jgi:hypothetical protein
MNDIKKLARLRKILSLAEHATDTAGTPAEIEAAKREADAARAKVFEMLAEYDISEEYLRSIDEAPDEMKVSVVFEIRKPFIQKSRLMHLISQQMHVVVVRGGKVKTTVQRITAYGFKQDMYRFQMVWLSILAQGEREYALTRIPVGVHPPTFKRGWWESFTVAIFERMTAEKQKAHSTATPGTEMVLRDRDAAVQDFVDEKTGGTRKGRRSGTRTYHGHREGYAAGQRVDLNDTAVGANATRKSIT